MCQLCPEGPAPPTLPSTLPSSLVAALSPHQLLSVEMSPEHPLLTASQCEPLGGVTRWACATPCELIWLNPPASPHPTAPEVVSPPAPGTVLGDTRGPCPACTPTQACGLAPAMYTAPCLSPRHSADHGPLTSRAFSSPLTKLGLSWGRGLSLSPASSVRAGLDFDPLC